MIAGHFGFAAAVKAKERQVPLWALMLATVWLDIVFVPLLLSGIETLEPAPGTHGGYGNNIIHADYTHSLVGAVLLSVLLGVFFGRWWGRSSAIVIGLVSFSHWILDIVVHRGDMPILPANYGHLPRLGFGLWRYPFASIAVEAAIVILGALLYWRAARAVTTEAKSRTWLAHISSLLILLGGLGVLALDASGAAG